MHSSVALVDSAKKSINWATTRPELTLQFHFTYFIMAYGVVVFLWTLVCVAWGHNDTSARIAFGSPASSREFPSYVLLYATNGGSCGGTLVRPNAVLTAAHCGSSAQYASIGNIRLSGSGVSSAVTVEVEYFVPHPDYDPRNLENDIAIAILSEDVSGITPVELSTRSIPRLNSKVTAIGMGDTHTQRQPTSLQKAVMMLRTGRDCHFDPSDPRVLCMRAARMGSGKYREVCPGDSGGPVFYRGKQFGVTSWKDGTVSQCGDGQFGVYVSVPYYYDSFILPVLEEYSYDPYTENYYY